MSRRHRLLALLAAALLVVNLFHWWLSSRERLTIPVGKGGGESFQAKDFQLHTVEPEETKTLRRDPFRARRLTRSKDTLELIPPKTPGEIAQETAKTELAQYRVVGIVFRNGRGHAYLIRGSETFLVSSGDKVGGRFTVVSIASDAVELHDPQTDISGKLPVVGQ